MTNNLITFCFSLTLLSSSFIGFSQSEYNKIFLYDQELIRNEIIHEAEDAYYAIGYADDGSNITVGIHVSKHDKISGEVINTTYFAIDSTWSFLEHSNDVYQEGNSLIFGLKGDQLYKLKYDISTSEISIIDETPFPNNVLGLYQHDLLVFTDTTLYVSSNYVSSDSIVFGLFFTYPDGSKEFKNIEQTDSLNVFGQMIKRENGNYVLFGGMDGDNGLWDRSLAIYEFDKDINLLSTFFKSYDDEYIQVNHVLPINTQEVLLVSVHLDWDNIRNMHAYSHYIHRYNITNREIIWSRKYGSPASNWLSGGKIVASHEDNHFLYCTDAVRSNATVNSFSTVGRVVKIDQEGERLWQKDYLYFSEHNDNHNLYDIIASSDENYLVSGRARANRASGWLLKINESGELLGDSLVNVNWTDNDWTKDIQIYPNPTIDNIYINQNNLDQVTYQLVDVNGRLLKEVNINAKDQGVIWNVSDLISSSYFIRIIRDGKVIGSTVMVKQE